MTIDDNEADACLEYRTSLGTASPLLIKMYECLQGIIRRFSRCQVEQGIQAELILTAEFNELVELSADLQDEVHSLRHELWQERQEIARLRLRIRELEQQH